MLDSIAEGAAARLPAGAHLRHRRGRRPRCASAAAARALNRALHELRRPLQALALQAAARRRRLARSRPARPGARGARRRSTARSTAATGRPRRGVVDGRALAAEAVGRWRGPAALEGRWIELAWHAGRLAPASATRRRSRGRSTT